MVRTAAGNGGASGGKAARGFRKKIGERVFDILIYAVIILFCAAMLYPFIYMISVSLTSRLYTGEVILWPIKPTIQAYKLIFSWELTLSGYKNSFVYVVTGVAFSLLFTFCAAYPVSKGWLPGRKGMLFFMLITMYFSGGLIPTYLVITRFLKMYDSIWVMILPGALNTYYAIIMITFFKGIPEELSEAAKIDGAGELRILWSIFIPLSFPITATLILFYGVGMWNSWFGPFLYLRTESKFPIQLVLRNLMTSFSVDSGQIGGNLGDQLDPISFNYALTVAVIIPILLIYPFIQKFFDKGVMVGSLKG
jgi:putative aldouronate transport system permease protein